MDGISFKVRHNGKIINKTVYLIVGLGVQGYKQVLGMWINEVESAIRKYTKTKTVFPDDSAALKAVFLAINNIEKKWTVPVHNFGIILNQFFTIFGE